MPIYHLDRPDDRLAIAANLPSRGARAEFVRRIRRRYGAEAAQAVIEGLHRIAAERQS